MAVDTVMLARVVGPDDQVAWIGVDGTYGGMNLTAYTTATHIWLRVRSLRFRIA